MWNLSGKVSDWLDREDFIPENYILEISSPGLGRQLKKDRDLIRENGKEVEIRLFKAIEKQKEFSGILKGFDECVLQLQNGDSDAVIIDEPVAKGYMKMKEGEFKAVGDTINAERYAMAVAKGNSELQEKLNTGLKNIIESGKWEIANMYEE